MKLDVKDYKRFEKQIILKKIGLAGQKKINNSKISMTISGGIAHSNDMNGDYSSYLTYADEKLYEAKNGGRNRIIL